MYTTELVCMIFGGLVVLATLKINQNVLLKSAPPKQRYNSSDEDSDSDEETEPYKMVLVVRQDLGMKAGKKIAQACHAAVGCVMRLNDEEILKLWYKSGCKKIAVKINSLEELSNLKDQCAEMNMNHYLVQDAGLTQIASGSKTVLGVGPGKASDIDKITGKLKLM